MKLVVDANIIISALISSKGKTCDLIFNDSINLSAPDYLFEELKKHKKEILVKSGLSESDLNLFLALISSRIKMADKPEFKRHLNEAEKITPDPNDMEYFALALKLGCAIWSNDKELKKQNKVNIYSTPELLKKFE